jgi:general stress protein 26
VRVNEPRDKLKSLIEKFDTAMLVTIDEQSRIHSRPMAIADAETEGELWFVTSRASGKTHEIASDLRCAVTMQGGKRFVSLTGIAELVDDRTKIREVWSETMRVWFSRGADDPEIVLIHFIPEEAEYWDYGGVINNVRFLLKAARVALSGDEARALEEPVARHGYVQL